MVDEESSLNGGWNEQNCFTGLRRFLESNNLPTEVDYKYEAFRFVNFVFMIIYDCIVCLETIKKSF